MIDKEKVYVEEEDEVKMDTQNKMENAISAK